MQIHYYVREDIVVDGAGDISFVTIFVVVRIDYHLMNDGVSTARLTSRIVGGLCQCFYSFYFYEYHEQCVTYCGFCR
jgi:hypothetical protein